MQEQRESKKVIISREEVKGRLKELLDRNEPMCIAIKGEWGVGKTYLLKEFLDNELKEEKHAYISLFGKYSLEDIKNDLGLQIVLKKVYNHKFIKTFFKGVKLSLGPLSVNVNVNIFDLIPKEKLKDVIICFDEFERLSPNLEMKEVLGFISYLRENSNCRIILILNEEKVTEENEGAHKVYNEYKEKLVDYEITLNPSVEENLEIATKEIHNISQSFEEAIGEFAHLLNIKNIRILKRLVNAYKDFSFIENIDVLKNEDGYYVKRDFYRKLILLSYIAYKYNKTKNLKEVLKAISETLIQKFFSKSSDHEKDLKPDEKEIMEIMENSPVPLWKSFFTFEESEDVKYICEYIKYNLLTENIKNGLRGFLIKEHEIIKNMNITNEFEKLIEELKFNFLKEVSDVEKEILNLISESSNLKALISSQGIFSFINTLLFIKKITGNERFFEVAKECFKEFVNLKKQELFRYYDDIKMHVNHLFDEDFRKYAKEILEKEMEEARKANTANISCEKVINVIGNIFQQSGWNKEDEFILNSLSKEFIKDCLKKSSEFTKLGIGFYRRTKGSSNFEKFLRSLEEAIEDLEIEKSRKDYIKNLLNSG